MGRQRARTGLLRDVLSCGILLCAASLFGWLQIKGEMSQVKESGRHDKRQAQKLQLELQQAKQLLKKLRNDQQVPSPVELPTV